MKVQSVTAVAVLLGIQGTFGISFDSSGDQMNLFVCAMNETVVVQVLTKDNESGKTCLCQAGPTRDPALREDYTPYVPGIGSHKLHTKAATWNDARRICHEENAHLAIINSKAEEALLMSLLIKAEKSIKGALNTEEAFLGIHDIYKEGEWVSILGESLYATGYSYWRQDGQPDNALDRQNCGAITIQGGMDDVFCDHRLAFFCELTLICEY